MSFVRPLLRRRRSARAPGSARQRLTVIVAAVVTVGASLSPTVLPAAAAGEPFQPLATPARLLDTRAGGQTVDGRFSGGGRIAAGGTLALATAGRGDIPSTAAAVVLNVTVVGASAGGYLTAFPCGGARPNASSLNYAARQVIPNAVVAGLGSGKVCFYSTAQIDLVVDASGSFAPSGISLLPTPARLLDTRPGGLTVDGDGSGTGALEPGAVARVEVAGRGGLSSSATSVVLNVTAVSPEASGYLSVFPCDAPVPNASSLNYVRGQTRPNAVVTRVGSTGEVCLYSSARTHAVIDVSAALPSSTFVPLAAPARVLETRDLATIDDSYVGVGAEPAGGTVQLPIGGRAGVPGTASAVVLNVTVVQASAAGVVTAYPTGAALPATSNLNVLAGDTVPNLVVAKVGAAGQICLTTSTKTDLVVDVTGYLNGPAPASADAACPTLAVSTSPDAVRSQVVGRAAMQVARGTDTVAVVVCHVPTGFPGYENRAPLPATPTAAAVAAAANASVTPYFRNVSGGAFVPNFVANAVPTITLRTPTATEPDGPEACLAQAQAVVTSAGYTNVFATDDRDVDLGSYSGLGGPGKTSSTETRDVLHRGVPSTTQRGLWVEGGSVWNDPDSIARANSERQYFNTMIVAHELGHTINWPHSHLGDDDYDNPLDLMSGNPGSPGDGWCNFYTVNRPPVVEGFSAPCRPQSALAYDRMAAGWMTSRQSAISTGVVTYLLDAANSSSANSGGTQVVAAVDPADTQSVLTVEGRAAVGYDADLTEPYCASVSSDGQCENIPGKEGVAVHLVRQNPSYTGDAEGRIGVGLQRRAAQAIGEPSTFDHVLVPGQSVVVDGVHITVYPRVGNAYPVRIWGTYTTPAFMKDPAAAKRLATPAPTAPTPRVEDGDAGSTPRPPRVSF